MLKKLRIRTRMVLLALLLVGFSLAVGYVGQRAFLRGEEAISTLYADRVVPLRDLKVIADMYAVNIVDTVHKANAGSLPSADALRLIAQARETIGQKWREYLATFLVPREQELVRVLEPAMREAGQAVERIVAILTADDRAALAAFAARDLYPAIDPVSEQLSRLIDLQIDVAQEVAVTTIAGFGASRTQMLVLIGLSILLGGLASFFIIRSITRPVIAVRAALERLAAGDLDAGVPDDGGRDEIADMARSAAGIAATLRLLASDLNEIIAAARAGALAVRLDPAAHRGEFATLVNGTNDILETLTAPLHELAAVMARLAAGDVGGRMTGEYRGDLLALKANVNRSLESLVAILSEIGGAAAAMAKGELAYRFEGGHPGEFGAIEHDLLTALEQLRGTVAEVQQATAQVSGAAEETAAAADEVARQAAGQMGTLVDVSDAIDQTAAAIGHIAQNAESGSSLAQEAAAAAELGAGIVSGLATAVQGIAHGNEQINRILGRIAGIADKTYVLALNAGLEAARAGVQGGGFGLIAGKISTLAEEAGQATTDITSLVEEANRSVGQGVAAAAEAGAAIGRILETAQQSGQRARSIAAAIEQQNAMVRLLAERVQQLQAAGHTTASAAEEISTTMRVLSATAQGLRDETARLRTA